jgi:hypothetical protein
MLITIKYRVRCFVRDSWQEHGADDRKHALNIVRVHNSPPNAYTKGNLAYAVAVTPKGKRVKIG